MREWNLYIAVLVLRKCAEINKYPVTQTFLAENSYFLVKDKILFRKALYQIPRKNISYRGIIRSCVNHFQINKKHNAIFNSSDLNRAVFCVIDNQAFTKQITACEGMHCYLVEVFVLEGTLDFALQQQSCILHRSAELNNIVILYDLFYTSVQQLDCVGKLFIFYSVKQIAFADRVNVGFPDLIPRQTGKRMV